jgi:hypothetical protein
MDQGEITVDDNNTITLVKPTPDLAIVSKSFPRMDDFLLALSTWMEIRTVSDQHT